MLGLATFSSLRYRDYRFLWGSMVFSSSGQWMEQVALSWLVWDLTKDPFMLGAIGGARAVPFFLSPLGGVAADRIDRKLLMLSTQIVVMTLSLGMALLLFLDVVQLWMVFVFTILSGVTWAFNQPVRQAIVPNLVPREQITNAVALSSSAFNLTRLVGPIAAGFIIAGVGVEGAFAAKGVAYVGVIGMIVLMKVPAISPRARRGSILANLAGGFSYVKSNTIVLTLLLIALIPMLVSMPYVMTFMPVFADEVYGIGPEGMGLLYTAAGIGSLGGTLTVASLGNFSRKGLLLLLSGVGMGVMLVLFGSASWMPVGGLMRALFGSESTLPLTLLVLVGVGFPQMFTMSLTQTLLQMSITDEVRGRVMSIYMLDRALTPLGSLFAGTMGRQYGAPQAVVIGGILTAVLGVAALVFLPTIRNWNDATAAVARARAASSMTRREAGETAAAVPAQAASREPQRSASGEDSG